MAGNPDAGERSATVQQALSVVDLGHRASSAYGRPDLAERLALTRRRLSDPAFHVFVVGEFKQGKSSLVNALLDAAVCPVDDDIATAVPTVDAATASRRPRRCCSTRAATRATPTGADPQEIAVEQWPGT